MHEAGQLSYHHLLILEGEDQFIDFPCGDLLLLLHTIILSDYLLLFEFKSFKNGFQLSFEKLHSMMSRQRLHIIHFVCVNLFQTFNLLINFKGRNHFSFFHLN